MTVFCLSGLLPDKLPYIFLYCKKKKTTDMFKSLLRPYLLIIWSRAVSVGVEFEWCSLCLMD